MRTHLLATNAFSVLQKAMVHMVVFCILLNGLMPRFMLEYRNSGEMKQVIENQAVLLTQINSLMGFAVKIANAFLKDPVPRPAAPLSKGKKTPANTSSEYSLISTEKRLLPVTVFDRSASLSVQLWPAVLSLSGARADERRFVDWGMLGIFILLVLRLFSYARSDVYDLMKGNNGIICPTCASELGFFISGDEEPNTLRRTGELK